MNARLDALASPVTGKLVKHLVAAGKVVEATGLPVATQELVKIRASQINGCGGCLDMHTKEAAAAGRPRCACTWSPPGGRPPSSPRPSARRWS